ncbi:uncharacterized protein LOC143473533 [Brachyhypopomus gauderio]|uniref:uncharacterized protein LOC143473533 n=1 Tax=Brachyhypopomus gauderio TaxID=698409 RepID=UPI004041809F
MFSIRECQRRVDGVGRWGILLMHVTNYFVGSVEKLGILLRNVPMAECATSVEAQTTSTGIAQTLLPTSLSPKMAAKHGKQGNKMAGEKEQEVEEEPEEEPEAGPSGVRSNPQPPQQGADQVVSETFFARSGSGGLLFLVGVEMREVVKKSKEKGGKGLPDPHLFLGSQFIWLHVKYALLTEWRKNKAAATSRFWIGSYLRSLGLLALDLKTPVAFKMSQTHVFIQKFLRKYNIEQSGEKVLTNAKEIVGCVQEREEVSRIPGLTQREAQRVWRNAAHPSLPNRNKDLSWLAAHEVLPVRAVMHSRGMATTATCPRPGCGEPETVRHALWECRVARDLWATVGPLKCPSLPAGEVHARDYRLAISWVGQGVDTLPAKEFETLWLTHNSVKSASWTSRNLLVGKRVTVPLHAMQALVTSSLQGAPGESIWRRGPRLHAGGSPSPPAGAPADAPGGNSLPDQGQQARGGPPLGARGGVRAPGFVTPGPPPSVSSSISAAQRGDLMNRDLPTR